MLTTGTKGRDWRLPWNWPPKRFSEKALVGWQPDGNLMQLTAEWHRGETKKGGGGRLRIVRSTRVASL